jgi:anti-sigma factor RsiW
MARLRSRTMKSDRRAPKIVCCSRPRWVGVVLALACAALIGACGSSKSATSQSKAKLDTARVARSIEQSILAQRHLRSTVVCPTAVPQVKGETFECLATTRTITKPVKVGKTPFLVTIQNGNGYVTYAGK